MEYLIDAIAQLRAEGRNVELDIVGGRDDQVYQDLLMERARSKGIMEHVLFHGQIPFGESLFKIFRNADLQVISSLSEGLPRCVTEGRAFGLPTIATAVGGIPSVVHDGQDGLLVPPGDAGQIAAAICRILDDPELRRRIISRGYDLAEVQTAEYQAKRMACLMQYALDGRDVEPWGRDLSAMGEIEQDKAL